MNKSNNFKSNIMVSFAATEWMWCCFKQFIRTVFLSLILSFNSIFTFWHLCASVSVKPKVNLTYQYLNVKLKWTIQNHGNRHEIVHFICVTKINSNSDVNAEITFRFAGCWNIIHKIDWYHISSNSKRAHCLCKRKGKRNSAIERERDRANDSIALSFWLWLTQIWGNHLQLTSIRSYSS